MLSVVVTMTLILALTLGLVLVVMVGIAGHGSDLLGNRVSGVLRRVALHLNGDAEPPEALVRLLDAAHR